ncbi:MAG: Pyridoxamine-phosphate oxidase [Roseibaca calidilacus]|uniref:Pyridoxamine-phosphate oxidase n=1 Tax=Roseibaca calidilacus TaxID=1666912 RepID=A0A0P8A4E1_9RHOB|nr:pyridoxamine 5'-phosphate oxidase family protein [Roseibaca calidilacus]KPP88954.1 MAG: Pyridoxamine-phosphate oxidase [Roseibaca calidilacus]CUX79346.1 Pyridoxine/pyridoxamine 5'-phosphate oxidase [Roseibaca calidilacus]
MTQDPFVWAQSLDTLFEQVWSRLSRGVRDRHAPARHPTLATVSTDGRPQLRTVVLRGAEKADGTLRVYTDMHSHKVAELQATPFAALHIWDSSAHLQIRLATLVTILTGAEVAELWHQLPDHARLAYGSTPAPGTALPAALDYSKTPDPTAFAVLHLTIDSMDVVHLGPNHRRAAFRREDDWAGQWLAP